MNICYRIMFFFLRVIQGCKLMLFVEKKRLRDKSAIISLFGDYIENLRTVTPFFRYSVNESGGNK